MKKDIPQGMAKDIEPRCCSMYNIDWNGRRVDDIICAKNKKEDPSACVINNKIFASTLYRYCFLENLKKADAVLKNPEEIKSILIFKFKNCPKRILINYNKF